MVERIIHKILVEKIDIDKLLVVTFTNAAAAEMRERILEAIYQKIEENPEDANLQKQLLLMNKASICTIHSFCLDVIKNHFYELDLSPSFRIGEEAEIELLKQEALEDLFERQYEQQEKDFLKLIDIYTNYQDDQNLKDVILAIYRFIQAAPFPEKWLEEKIAMYQTKEKNSFENTIWGTILLSNIEEELASSIKALEELKRKLAVYPELTKYTATIEKDIETLVRLKQNTNIWDNLYHIWRKTNFEKWPIDRKVTMELKEEAKGKRDKIKKKITTMLDRFLIDLSDQIREDRKEIEEILHLLQTQIVAFSKCYAEKKREKNIIDFNDIEHFALAILVEEKEDGTYGPTEVAKKYQEKFEEIAVDEYQDSNLVQEYILKTVSKKKNRFMVGDVKQSIYQFRQARPELFLEKYNSYALKNEKREEQDLKIQLFKNFRSRENILDFTNLIFSNIMSKELGKIDYDKKEYLNLGANYPEIEENKEHAGKAEFHLLNLKEEEETEEAIEEPIENTVLEAKLVAQKIKELLESGYQVYDKKKGYRNITYQDIAILLRATSNAAPIYEKELQEAGFPVFSDTSAEYLDSIEIQTIMSLLKIIDNPIQDIPLVTVLRSSIANFTDNDLIEIRILNPYTSFYEALLEARIQVNKELKKKINDFLKKLEQWRKEQEYLALDELIWKIYFDTGYYHYVGLMPNGTSRQANLKMLFQRAKEYEKSSFKGLFQFIHFIDKLKSYHNDLSAAKMIGENENVIRIMSIHKSKGLEFPVVFLCATNKKFNKQDLNKEILLDQDLGFGMKYINYDKKIEYNTLEKEAVALKKKEDNIAEEMRILYVALTRSKEKLYITGVSKNWEEEWKEKEEKLEIFREADHDKIEKSLLKTADSYLDWMELVWIKNKEKMETLATMTIHSKAEVLKEKIEETKESMTLEEKIEKRKTEKTKQGKERVRKALEWKYPYEKAIAIPTKTSVSEIKQKEIQKQKEMREKREDADKREKKEEIPFKKPKFMEEERQLTAAERGTILHLCMQKLKIGKQYDLPEIEKMLWELWQKDILTKQEVESVSKKAILDFTHSNIWKQMRTSKESRKRKNILYGNTSRRSFRRARTNRRENINARYY